MKTFNVEYVETRLVYADEQPTGAITRDPDTGRPYCRRLPSCVFPFVLRMGGMANVRATNADEAASMMQRLSKDGYLQVTAVEMACSNRLFA